MASAASATGVKPSVHAKSSSRCMRAAPRRSGRPSDRWPFARPPNFKVGPIHPCADPRPVGCPFARTPIHHRHAARAGRPHPSAEAENRRTAHRTPHTAHRALACGCAAPAPAPRAHSHAELALLALALLARTARSHARLAPLAEEVVACGHGGEHTDELQRHAVLDKVAEAVAALAGDHQVGLVRDGSREGGGCRQHER
eukprot:5071731-Prymnesium_polylepis.1